LRKKKRMILSFYIKKIIPKSRTLNPKIYAIFKKLQDLSIPLKGSIFFQLIEKSLKISTLLEQYSQRKKEMVE